ncbi:wax ester/triacylglycerol synthase domain-containing protein [Spirillospora sp. NPDC048911]|uniref:wax ester/triacylglycerol synthase domain-containing protein n=1 Tax=Spirillospora sp. NPDC048911 TaxID=3364527 RepID=UPI003716D3E2
MTDNHQIMPSDAHAVPMGSVDRYLSGLADKCKQTSNMHIGGIVRVKGVAPTLEELRELVAAQIGQTPVLGYRPHRDQRQWEPDPDFQVADHVTESPLHPGADLLAHAMEAIGRPLPEDRPPWRLVLFRGEHDPEHDRERYALCYYTDHAFQDGIAISRTVEVLFNGGTLPRPRPDEFAEPVRPWRWPAPSRLAVPVRRTTPWAPFGGPFSGRRRALSVDFDAEAVRATSARSGATRNQVCVAALAWALREWAPGEWSGPKARRGLKVALPLSLRPPRGSGCLGNQVTGLHITLPCHLPAPADQLRHVIEQTGEQVLQRHRALHRALSPRLPYGLARPFLDRLFDPAYTAMFITTVRMNRLQVGGMPIEEVWGIPPLLPDQPLTIALFQYDGTVRPTLLCDDALQGCDRLAELWQKGVSVLHEAVCAPR